MKGASLTKWFEETRIDDTADVGGKGASLGEMFQKLSESGVKVPNGFTLTTEAFSKFINSEIPERTWDNVRNPEGVEDIRNEAIKANCLSKALEVCLKDVDLRKELDLNARAALARSLVRETPVPESVKLAIASDYGKLCDIYYPGVDLSLIHI